jgi:hypothetical protein
MTATMGSTAPPQRGGSSNGPVDMDALRAEIRAMVDAAIGGAPADDAALRDAAPVRGTFWTGAIAPLPNLERF